MTNFIYWHTKKKFFKLIVYIFSELEIKLKCDNETQISIFYSILCLLFYLVYKFNYITDLTINLKIVHI